MSSAQLVGYANLSPIFALQYASTDSNLSSASIRDLVEQKRQKSDDAVEVMKQRAEKVQQARLDLQERIKSIRSLVHSTTKKTNDFSSPSFPVEKYAAVKNLARSPAKIDDRLTRDVEQSTLSEDDALWRGGNAHYLRVQQQESPAVARTAWRPSVSPEKSLEDSYMSIPAQSPSYTSFPALSPSPKKQANFNFSHVDDRPISLPAEYMSTKRVIEPEQKAKFQRRQDFESVKNLERVQLSPRLDIQSPQTLQKRTPMTGLDRLDRNLAAIDSMGISNFDGQGILAPEKTEIEAEVVGSITMKEQLWRIKQQREALKARTGSVLEEKLLFASPIKRPYMDMWGVSDTSPREHEPSYTSRTFEPSLSPGSTSRTFEPELKMEIPQIILQHKLPSHTHAQHDLRSDTKHELHSQIQRENYPGEARSKYATRVLEAGRNAGFQRVVGLHVALATGLRVKPVDEELPHSKGGPGFITKVNSDLDACFVKWDLTEEECGWYRCGAYGTYTLRLLPSEEETEAQITNMLTSGGNSRDDIQNRNADYHEKHGLEGTNVLINIMDLLGL